MWMYAVIATLMAMCLGACSEAGTGGEPQEPATWYHAGFYLTVGEQNTTSRAPQEGTYDPGEGYENYVDLDNVQVHLYDMAGNYSGPVTDFTITPIGESSGGKRYKLDGKTKVNISSGKFKVVVLANWPTYPENLSLGNLWETTFTFNPSVPLSSANALPLYGVKDVSLTDVKPTQLVNLGTIHLLRAVAKIEVIVDDPEDFWYVKTLRLTHYNTVGFCAPQVMSQSEYVKDNWNQDYVGRAFVPENSGVRTDLDFRKIADRTESADHKDHYLLYVPEYYNNVESIPMSQISVEFENSTSGVQYIPFYHPVSGNTMDIMRNLWYKITIRKKDENSNIRFEVDVIPYKVCELDPIFGLTPATH